MQSFPQYIVFPPQMRFAQKNSRVLHVLDVPKVHL